MSRACSAPCTRLASWSGLVQGLQRTLRPTASAAQTPALAQRRIPLQTLRPACQSERLREPRCRAAAPSLRRSCVSSRARLARLASWSGRLALRRACKRAFKLRSSRRARRKTDSLRGGMGSDTAQPPTCRRRQRRRLHTAALHAAAPCLAARVRGPLARASATEAASAPRLECRASRPRCCAVDGLRLHCISAEEIRPESTQPHPAEPGAQLEPGPEQSHSESDAHRLLLPDGTRAGSQVGCLASSTVAAVSRMQEEQLSRQPVGAAESGRSRQSRNRRLGPTPPLEPAEVGRLCRRAATRLRCKSGSDAVTRRLDASTRTRSRRFDSDAAHSPPAADQHRRRGSARGFPTSTPEQGSPGWPDSAGLRGLKL